jgi:hypothetical protein
VTRAAGVYRNTCRNKGTRGNKVVKIKSRAESREQRSRGAEEQRRGFYVLVLCFMLMFY